ncbi:hypothetical protein ABT040_10630 [Streptomyces sp. NPDC002688]|uniref:hypothetical protein n=1 Tax=Streptomyces sp. NPDC002688 TaxID=3154423 RepID=UPI00332DE5DC
MRALATRPQRLALVCSLISAATLGTVSASAASASGESTVPTATAVTAQYPSHARTTEPPKGAPPAIAYRPTAHAPGDVNTADDAFAACMRGHGQKVFPDFHASKDRQGHIRFEVRMRASKGFDPTSKSYRAAVKACAPILKKAGITFSSGTGLPPLPVPGKPGGEHGTGSGGGSVKLPPRLHAEKGEPGAPDLPSFSSSIESA